MKLIGIIGCGWLGSKLADRLKGEFKIYATARKQQTVDELASLGYSAIKVDFSEEKEINVDQWNVVPSLDIIVVLVPFSMRKSSLESLNNKVKNLCSFIGKFDGQLFFSSTTGVYPKIKDTFKEDDLSVEENGVECQLKNNFPRINILRLGGLMGDNRLLSKYKVKGLEDPVNHIHYEDACSVIIRMIELQLRNRLYNVVAPLHPSKEEVIKAQNGNPSGSISEPEGRIISSSKLKEELEFKFTYPDPRKFHE